MDYSRFDKETNELIRKMLDQKKLMDEGVFDTLSELISRAEASEEDDLIGFVHYHIADSLYAFEVDYGRFRKHMSQAVSHLIGTDEDETLTRAYNYLGVDASNNGVFDVAYYHFVNALNTCEHLNNNYLMSIVNNNIGQIFARMGYNDKALEYVKLSNEQQLMSSKDDVYYYQNAVNGHFSEGVLNVLLGNIERAKELEMTTRKLDEESGIPGLTNIIIPVSFLRLQLAVIENDEEYIEEYFRESKQMISDAHRLFDYITDIRDLCIFLIDHERYEIVRSIIDTVSHAIIEANVPRMKQHLYAIEIAYYEKQGKMDELAKVLLDQHHADLEQEEEQSRIRLTSMELIDTMNNLRKQKRQLEIQAQTDALTGIPNRLSMEKDIDAAFEKAYSSSTSFAIEILDIDCFKDYNDYYGHPAGDVCLKKIAEAISRLSEEEGFRYARYGGDEFVLIFERKDEKEIHRIAKALESKIDDLALIHKKAKSSDRISISQGVCCDIPQGRVKPWDFFSTADDALYAAKSNRYSQEDRPAICIVNLDGDQTFFR